jgi:riboflavin kinase/FMN adenylyltransferase
LDIDMILIEEFSKRIAGIDYRNFISNWLVERLGMRHMIIGYDFHMGRSREGSQDRLLEEGRRTGFGVTVVAPVVMGGRVVSSTNIRRLIKERKLEQAARFLTRPYFFDADVVRGEGLGRKIDFPTANVEVRSEGKLLPPGGIYGVWVEVDGRLYGGMMNIGSAPTIHNEGDVRIEVHVFDFSGDLYGKRIRIHCLKFIRDEKRFECVDALQAQLVRDRREVMLILEKKH